METPPLGCDVPRVSCSLLTSQAVRREAHLTQEAIDDIDLPLTDLDQMAVGIADVGADFIAAVDGVSHKLCAAAAPLAVHLADVGNAYVEERANGVGVGGREREIYWMPKPAYQHGAARLDALNPDAFTQLRVTGNPGQLGRASARPDKRMRLHSGPGRPAGCPMSRR
jgi:hypothetical protein